MTSVNLLELERVEIAILVDNYTDRHSLFKFHHPTFHWGLVREG